MLVQNYLRNRKEANDREEEHRGLLRIVDVEMSSNDQILSAAIAVNLKEASGAQIQSILDLRDLEAVGWDRTKIDLARMADENHFTKLHEYYWLVIKTSARVQQLASSGDLSNRRLRPAQALAQGCKTAGDAASLRSKALLSNNKVSRSA